MYPIVENNISNSDINGEEDDQRNVKKGSSTIALDISPENGDDEVTETQKLATLLAKKSPMMLKREEEDNDNEHGLIDNTGE